MVAVVEEVAEDSVEAAVEQVPAEEAVDSVVEEAVREAAVAIEVEEEDVAVREADLDSEVDLR